MRFFNSAPPKISEPSAGTENGIPILPVDLSKRYDVYCSARGHDRLYENVRFVGMRTFDRITESMHHFMMGDFLEIESADGTRSFLPKFGINLICEHGARPAFKVLRRRHDSSE